MSHHSLLSSQPSISSDASLPSLQHFPLSSLPAEQRDAFDDATIPSAPLPAIMLWKYLAYIALPACLRFGELPIETVPRFLAPWPELPELKRAPGTRVLEKVNQHDPWGFAKSVRDYIGALPDFHLGPKEGVRMRLPADMFLELDEDDVERLSYIDGIDELVGIVKDDVLHTACECIRIIERMPPEAPLFSQLQFTRATNLCTAHFARWDILAMRPDMFSAIPLVVIVVPPWEMSAEALGKFTFARTFPDHRLDTLPPSPLDNSDKLWAVVNDVCHQRAKYFIVTNYTHWMFGSFSNNWKQTAITKPVQARTVQLESKGVRAGHDHGANVVESLIYWIQVARGVVKNG